MTGKARVTQGDVAIVEGIQAWWQRAFPGRAVIERDGWQAYHAAREAAREGATRQLLSVGARVREDFRGATISFAGVRAQSTCGISGAMANWIASAQRKCVAAKTPEERR